METPFIRLSVYRDLFTSIDSAYYLQNPGKIYSTDRNPGVKDPYLYQEEYATGNSSSLLSSFELESLKKEVDYARVSANERRGRWNQMIVEAKAFQPSFNSFTDNFFACTDSGAFPLDKYKNGCVNCIGVIYMFIYGSLVLILYLLCALVAYPALWIYDAVSGRSRTQEAWLRHKLIDEEHGKFDSANTDAALLLSLQRSAAQLSGVLGPRFSVAAAQDVYKLSVRAHDSEDNLDYTELHDCARFSLLVNLNAAETGAASNV